MGLEAYFQIQWKAGDITWLPYAQTSHLNALSEYLGLHNIPSIAALPLGNTPMPQDDPQISLGSISFQLLKRRAYSITFSSVNQLISSCPPIVYSLSMSTTLKRSSSAASLAIDLQDGSPLTEEALDSRESSPVPSHLAQTNAPVVRPVTGLSTLSFKRRPPSISSSVLSLPSSNSPTQSSSSLPSHPPLDSPLFRPLTEAMNMNIDPPVRSARPAPSASTRAARPTLTPFAMYADPSPPTSEPQIQHAYISRLSETTFTVRDPATNHLYIYHYAQIRLFILYDQSLRAGIVPTVTPAGYTFFSYVFNLQENITTKFCRRDNDKAIVLGSPPHFSAFSDAPAFTIAAPSAPVPHPRTRGPCTDSACTECTSDDSRPSSHSANHPGSSSSSHVYPPRSSARAAAHNLPNTHNTRSKASYHRSERHL
jgi:hypothetical protein